MGFFKRSFQKNVTRDNEFFKNFAIKLNTLMRYTEANEKVTAELKKLQNDFQYTVATSDRHAKKNEHNIEKMYDELKAMLQQPTWDEQQVLLLVRNMGAEIDEINSMR
ncbi:MAG: hypothetical protein IJC64_03420 [Clostridia bacterium]|nr:hypothetical protein [Clostridia bacterium]